MQSRNSLDLDKVMQFVWLISRLHCYSCQVYHGDTDTMVGIFQVRYSGGSCNDANLGYFIGFGTVFYLVSFVSIVQLVSSASNFLLIKLLLYSLCVERGACQRNMYCMQGSH